MTVVDFSVLRSVFASLRMVRRALARGDGSYAVRMFSIARGEFSLWVGLSYRTVQPPSVERARRALARVETEVCLHVERLAARANAAEVDAIDLVAPIARSIGILRTYEGVVVSEEHIYERARSVATIISLGYRVLPNARISEAKAEIAHRGNGTIHRLKAEAIRGSDLPAARRA